MSGSVGYHSGLAAEDIVARFYEAREQPIVHRRWRGKAGEIDLIAQNADQVIFVEVKKSKDFATAAYRLGQRQIDRLIRAGSEFIGNEPCGLLTDVRYDLALVNGRGEVKVIENAIWDS